MSTIATPAAQWTGFVTPLPPSHSPLLWRPGAAHTVDTSVPVALPVNGDTVSILAIFVDNPHLAPPSEVHAMTPRTARTSPPTLLIGQQSPLDAPQDKKVPRVHQSTPFPHPTMPFPPIRPARLTAGAHPHIPAPALASVCTPQLHRSQYSTPPCTRGQQP